MTFFVLYYFIELCMIHFAPLQQKMLYIYYFLIKRKKLLDKLYFQAKIVTAVGTHKARAFHLLKLLIISLIKQYNTVFQ